MYLYKDLPVLQDDKYILLFNNATDGNDFVMAFDKAKNELPLQDDDDNHYLTIAFKRMNVALNLWKQAHKKGWYFRWTIIDKTIGDTIGIIEEIERADDDELSNYVWLKIDFEKRYEKYYENEKEIMHLLSLIVQPTFEFFACENIAIKIISFAKQRIKAVSNLGFIKLQNCPIKHDRTQSGVYYVLNKFNNTNENSTDSTEKSNILTDPKKLVARELKKAGFDISTIKVPTRVFILADSLYDTMLSKNCGKYKYPLGGKLFVFDGNDSVGFIKGAMCSPAIATQAEDLIAGGVKELIHIGFAGGLQQDMYVGDIVLTDGAYNDTAVARLYGFDYDFIESTKSLTDELCKLLKNSKINHRRGKHWTTDAGYMETYAQVVEHRNKGTLCVEMEGVGLFTVANYRKCRSSAIYIISDILANDDWSIGWSEKALDTGINKIIDTLILSIQK